VTSSDGSIKADLERELTRFLRRSRVTSAAIAADVHPDLDVASYTVLVTISDLSHSRPGGVRASDVADALRLHKSTMSRTLSMLERLGLVQRRTSDQDARARDLTLTPSGRASLDAAISARRQRVAEALTRWPVDDVAELARLLAKLNDDLA
jgi:DNA-binding MarR family transcriptional regulator